MENVKIKNKKYNAFEVYETKVEAFERTKKISNNTKIYKTDDGKFAIFLVCQNVTNLY